MTKSGIDASVRGWILRTHPGEKGFIGDFDKRVTWREVVRRMLAGEDFYDICNCGDSVQREYAFGEMSRLFAVPYRFFYDCWLQRGKGLDAGTRARVSERVATAG